MQLITYTRLNRLYFASGNAPTKAQWTAAIEKGEVGGKVVMGKVWVDIDEFLSRDIFQLPHEEGAPKIDLLA